MKIKQSLTIRVLVIQVFKILVLPLFLFASISAITNKTFFKPRPIG